MARQALPLFDFGPRAKGRGGRWVQIRAIERGAIDEPAPGPAEQAGDVCAKPLQSAKNHHRQAVNRCSTDTHLASPSPERCRRGIAAPEMALEAPRDNRRYTSVFPKW